MSAFTEQVERIERVKTTLGLNDAQLAAKVGLRPETLQKYAAGYQKAGDRFLRLIETLPPPSAEADKPSSGADKTPPSISGQLTRILKSGTIEEVRIVRNLIESLFQQVTARDGNGGSSGGFAFLAGRHRLLPALGYIPAGMPQEAIQQANQFVAVPEDKFKQADYALKVQGDSMVGKDVHHGDWVAMSLRREPRNGNIVAALCDGETTLKTYVVEGRQAPYLRAENKNFPAKIVPRHELKVQGVVVGKLVSQPRE